MGERLSEAHLNILRHSLGLSRSREAYRNHFCAGDGHADMPLINDLVDAGFMRLSHRINEGRDTIYVVTPAGRAALGAKDA